MKRMLQLFCREGAERAGTECRWKNSMKRRYDVLQNTDLHAKKATNLNKLKAKVITLHSAQRMGALIDTGEQDRMLGEEPSLHHLLKGRKCQEQPTVNQIYDTGI
jgi:hypothetical protein